MEPNPTKRFRIALSYAGEKRDFVAQVAAILAERFGKERILYDKYHQAKLSRSDLAFYLPELYEKEAELVVVVFCPNYEDKEWCGLEWNAIFGLLKKRRATEVMLTRFERVEGKGLHGLAGYTDLDELTPEQAASVILERLAVNEGKPQDCYAKSLPQDGRPALTSITNNLPRLQSFFNRDAELGKIREAIAPDNRTSWGTLIDGRGGMGKTSLAVRAAYDCTPEQFKRIVFVSAKDRELDDDGVRELGVFVLPGLLEMLNELARELGHDEITTAPEAQRIRLLLEALRGEQALLILDNLESLPRPDRNKLLNFVERLPPGCKAILTSREPFGNAEDGFELEQLDQDAALAIIDDIATRSKQLAKASAAERIALYEQTNGSPLLLRWVAGQVGRGSRLSIADALGFLRSCPLDNDPLEFVFGDLLNEFTEDETEVLCALSHFTLPVKVEHVAPVAGCDDGTADDALGSLINRSLVVPDVEERAFVLVSVVADFLRRWKREVVAETGDRLEKRAFALVTENGYSRFDNFPVIDAAWPMVAAALPRFLAGPDDRLQTVCAALTKFLEFTGRWDEWLTLSRDAEVKAKAIEDFWEAGWRAYAAGWVHHLYQQPSEVFACADRADAHWQKVQAGDYYRATVLQLRGLGYRLASDYPSAIAAFRKAVKLFSASTPESGAVAAVLKDLAEAERLAGDLDAAERDYQEALWIAVAVGYREVVASIAGNLALLALSRGNWSGVEALAREGLALAEKIGRKESIASGCHWLAIAIAKQGRKPEAIPHARRAVEIFTALRHPELEEARQTLAECES